MIISIVQYQKNKSKILIPTLYKGYQRKLSNSKNSTKILKIFEILSKIYLIKAYN
jgi:hypothetical protein